MSRACFDAAFHALPPTRDLLRRPPLPQQTRHGFEERCARRQSVPPTVARRILHPNMGRARIIGVGSAVAGYLLGHGPHRSPKLGSDGRQGQPITSSKLDLHPLHSRQSYAISCHRTILSNVVRWCFLSNLNPPKQKGGCARRWSPPASLCRRAAPPSIWPPPICRRKAATTICRSRSG